MPAIATEPRSPGRHLRPRGSSCSRRTTSRDPGIDLAGSSHMHYPPGVGSIGLPCTSGIRPRWIVHALQSRLRRRLRRLGRRRVRVPPGLRGALGADRGRGAGADPGARDRCQAAAHGGDLLGLRRAIHEARAGLLGRTAPARSRRGAERPPRRKLATRPAPAAPTTTSSSSAAASAGWNPRSSSATWATRSCSSRRSQRRRQDDPALQGLPDPRLRELHLDAEDGGDDAPPEPDGADRRRVEGIRPRRRRPLHREDPQKPRFVDTSLHRLPPVRDGVHGGGAGPVQRRPRRPPRRVHPLPAGGAAEGARRARRHLALLLRLPGRDQGARLRLARPQRRRREGVPARAGSHAADRQPRPRLLRAVRGECTRGSLEGALPIRRIKRFVADTHDASGTDNGIERRSPTAREWRSSAPGRPA